MNYLIDYHTHSTNSMDGKDNVMDMCQSAIQKGIQEIAITDHFEPTVIDGECKQYKPNAYWSDIIKARHKFKGRLKIKAGVELGQPQHFADTSELLINSFPYDYVIGSAHKFIDGTDASQLRFDEISLEDLCIMYLKELKSLAEWGKFDCIGHLDLIKRYGAIHYKEKITLTTQYDLLEDLFKTLISKGKGIEINTSGLRQGPKETMPGLDVLLLYRKLGGELLTIGSDGHTANDIGKGIAEAIELSKEAGFKYITVFENRLPEWIKISDKTNIFGLKKQLNIS